MSQIINPMPDSHEPSQPAADHPVAAVRAAAEPERHGGHAIRNTIVALSLAALTALGIRALRTVNGG